MLPWADFASLGWDLSGGEPVYQFNRLSLNLCGRASAATRSRGYWLRRYIPKRVRGVPSFKCLQALQNVVASRVSCALRIIQFAGFNSFRVVVVFVHENCGGLGFHQPVCPIKCSFFISFFLLLATILKKCSQSQCCHEIGTMTS